MSFWSNFGTKAPAILAGGAGVSGLAAGVFPAQAALFQGIASIFGLLGASLHSLNPVTPVQPVVPVVSQQPAASVVPTSPVVPAQAFPVLDVSLPASAPATFQAPPAVDAITAKVLQAEQITQIVLMAVDAYKQSQSTAPTQPKTETPGA